MSNDFVSRIHADGQTYGISIRDSHVTVWGPNGRTSTDVMPDGNFQNVHQVSIGGSPENIPTPEHIDLNQ